MQCYRVLGASSEQLGHVFSCPPRSSNSRSVAGTGQPAWRCSSSAALLAHALAMRGRFLADHKGVGGKNKLIKKIFKKSSYFSFSKVPIFLTIPPNYHLIRLILFPLHCCYSVYPTSLSKRLLSPSSQLAQYITITQLHHCNQIIKLHFKHTLSLTKEGASDMGTE